MKKLRYLVPSMDCICELNLIKLKFEEFGIDTKFEADFLNKELEIVCDDKISQTYITSNLNLVLNAKFLDEQSVDFIVENEALQKKILVVVLVINFLFFLIESIGGMVFNSLSLLADSLDMLSDAAIYGAALFVVGKSLGAKKLVAKTSGVLQLGLAVLGFVEVIKRVLGDFQTPNFMAMMIIALFALIANATCLVLLNKTKSKQAHLRASMICTSNDIIVNIGVIISGFLVFLTSSKIPDLLVGSAVFALVLWGSVKILKL